MMAVCGIFSPSGCLNNAVTANASLEGKTLEELLANNLAIVPDASKGAVRIFSKAAAIQYARDKNRVNSVHPGFVDTPMTVPGHSNPDVARQRLEATPLGRFGTPDDIAAGCLYLASDDAAWVTGSELVIDGGMTAN